MADWPIVPKYQRTKVYGNNTGNSTGTSLASNSTSGKLAWSEIIPSSDFDAHSILLSYSAHTKYGNSALVDIGLGAAGSEQVVVENILADVGKGSASAYVANSLLLPLHIPAGTRVAARQQVNITASVGVSVVMNLIGGGLAGIPSISRAFGIGVDTTNGSCGGSVIATPGTSNTESSWVELTSSLASDLVGFFILTTKTSNFNSDTIGLLDIGIGAAGSESILIEDILISHDSSSTSWYPGSIGPLWIPLAAGTRIAARYQCNSNVAGNEFSLALLGLVG